MPEPIDKEPRGATNLRIKFRSANLDEFIERYSVDVSRGGIFIRTREPLSVGSRLKLDFQLLDAGPLLEGEGTVVWIRQPDPARSEVTPGMGVRFDKLSPESQTRLDRILSEKERLGQTGKAVGLTKSSGGMAVRRPTGAFSTVDGAAKPLGAALAAGADARPTAGQSPTPPSPAAGAGAPRTTSVLSSQARPAGPASGFGRPRTTTGGMSALRAPPVPSGLFEAPTADDIDKALSVLEEKPGPVPPMPPPPAPRLGPDVPIEVADDASNEPTRVVSDPQEFAANEAVTGQGGSIVPESGVPELAASPLEDMTAPASADDEATMAASPAAFAAAERAIGGGGGAPEKKAASLDAPLGAHLQTPTPAPVVGPPPMPLRKKGIIVEPASPTESGRFRTNATYRRPNKSGKRIVAVLVLAVAAGAAFKFRDRLRKMIPTSSEVATAPVPSVASPTPNPSVTPEAGVNAAAADAAIAAVVEGPAAPTPPAPTPAPEAPEKGQQEKGQPEKHAAAPAEEDRPRRRKVQHAAAAEGEASAAGDKAAATDKPAAEKAAAADKPAGDKPVEVVTPGGDTPMPGTAETPPAAAAPMLKVTSTPAGAEVIIDGNSVGTTPFSSKDVDPAAAHAITLKKDGYEPQERAITAGDWSRLHGGPLKVSIKLRRSAPAAKAPEEEKKPEVEILTPDSP